MLGERLKKVREEKGFTQVQIAKILNVSASTIGMYEQGRRDPDTTTLKKLSEIYGCSSDYLLGSVEEKKLYAQITTEMDLDNPDLEKAYQEIGVAINQLLLNGTITDKQAVMLLEDAKREIQAKIELIRTDTERRT